MKKTMNVATALFFGLSSMLLVGAAPAVAQGPAGAGAAAAQDTPHSMNPIKWVKKDSKSSSESTGNRSELEKKLTPGLQLQGVLAANLSASEACAPFSALDGCLATLHASHNLGIDFNCLRAGVTGVHTNANTSGCKNADGEKSLSLSKAIHHLKQDVDAKQATREAEQQAREDLKGISG